MPDNEYSVMGKWKDLVGLSGGVSGARCPVVMELKLLGVDGVLLCQGTKFERRGES